MKAPGELTRTPKANMIQGTRIRKSPPTDDIKSSAKKSRSPSGDPIQFFSRSKNPDHKYLSNFARLPRGPFPTVEAAFGKAKYLAADRVRKDAVMPDFKRMTDGLQAKRAHGRKEMEDRGFKLDVKE